MKEVIKRMAQLAQGYDRYTNYIEDYAQWKAANEKNKALQEEWNDICTEHDLSMFGITCYANLGGKTEFEITEKFRALGYDV